MVMVVGKGCTFCKENMQKTSLHFAKAPNISKLNILLLKNTVTSACWGYSLTVFWISCFCCVD